MPRKARRARADAQSDFGALAVNAALDFPRQYAAAMMGAVALQIEWAAYLSTFGPLAYLPDQTPAPIGQMRALADAAMVDAALLAGERKPAPPFPD